MKKPKFFISSEGKLPMGLMARILTVSLRPVCRVWYFEFNPELGNTVSDKILNQIKNSTHMILIWSETTRNSPYVNQEIGAARYKKIPIVPLIEKSARFEGTIKDADYIRYDPNHPIDSIKKFIASLQKLLKETGYEPLDMKQVEQKLADFSDTLGSLDFKRQTEA